MEKDTPKVIASIEARMGASRLPGKVFADICGKPALERLIDRLKQCELLDGIIIATTENPGDDKIVSWARSKNIKYYRGSEDDVLLRVVEAQRLMSSQIVVEICGDMVLLDPEIVDLGIKSFLENECDVVTTTLKPSFPIGVDVVIFRLEDLEWVERNVPDARYREHVSLYFLRNSSKYRVLNLFAPARLSAPDYRFVLDYPEDLEFIRAVYTRLEPLYGDRFGLYEMMELLKKDPSLVEINRHCEDTLIQ